MSATSALLRQTIEVQLIVPNTNQDKDLKHARNNELTDRRSAAADAKAALLAACRTAKTAAEPAQAARQAERISLVEARESAPCGTGAAKLEERTPPQETLAAREQAAIEAAAAAEIEARQSAENARISRVVKDGGRPQRLSGTDAMLPARPTGLTCRHPPLEWMQP